jgi:hypothetical protein
VPGEEFDPPPQPALARAQAKASRRMLAFATTERVPPAYRQSISYGQAHKDLRGMDGHRGTVCR